MSRTRRHLATFPPLRLTSQLELDRPSLHHNITVLDPVLFIWLTVHLNRLNEVAVRIVQVRGRNSEVLIAVDRHVDVLEPRRADQIHRLRDDGIEAEHLFRKLA